MELQELYALMDRFSATGLTSLEWEQDGTRLALKKESPAPCFRPRTRTGRLGHRPPGRRILCRPDPGERTLCHAWGPGKQGRPALPD
jgi:hypothetical protein